MECAQQLKGRRPPRACPPDFEATFILLGRFDCEEHYKARRDTITRWLVEQGKDRLLKARAAYVSQMRASGQWITRQTKLVAHHAPRPAPVAVQIQDSRQVPAAIASHAAHYLRITRNGGMIVSPAGEGQWWVGMKRLSAAQMLDLARNRGFDDKVVLIMGSGERAEHVEGRADNR